MKGEAEKQKLLLLSLKSLTAAELVYITKNQRIFIKERTESNPESFMLSLFDLNGRKVYSNQISNLEVHSLEYKANRGFYVAQILGENGETCTKKIYID